MRSLTSAEYDMLADIGRYSSCKQDSIEPLAPIADIGTIASLRARHCVRCEECPGCSREMPNGYRAVHPAITDLGRLALRLANATLSDLITA